jgi:ATP-dependent helicase/nuclease subunit A
MREVVPDHLLARFFAGETGRRILAAEVIRREWSFNLRMRAEDALTPEEMDVFAGTIVLVQGTIDLCFMENGKWILLDYKTDRSQDVDEIRAHYSRQLGLYSTALERITGISVNEKLLCLLRKGMVLKL